MLLNELWLKLMLAMIGNYFGDLTDLICGAVCSSRNKGSKVIIVSLIILIIPLFRSVCGLQMPTMIPETKTFGEFLKQKHAINNLLQCETQNSLVRVQQSAIG